MAIKEKTIKVRCCDFCDTTEENENEVINQCSNCGKDFCTEHGELFNTQYGNVEVEGCDGELTLCQECLQKIFNKNKNRRKYARN